MILDILLSLHWDTDSFELVSIKYGSESNSSFTSNFLKKKKTVNVNVSFLVPQMEI